MWKLFTYGSRRVQIAVSEAVTRFNAGAGSVIELHSSVGSELSSNAYHSLRKEDKRRLIEAAKKISLKARLFRRRKRAERKSKVKEKVSYLSGAFGVKDTPDEAAQSSKSQKKTNLVADPEIIFFDSVTFILNLCIFMLQF